MKLRLAFILCLQLIFFAGQGQDMMYFNKLGNIASSVIRATDLYNKVDSFKKTRRPNDSNIEIYFDRDVDFGYKHERINLTLNGEFRYKINLLTKSDTIYLSSVLFDDGFYDAYKKLNLLKIDTIQAKIYLKLRNNFYGSSKTLNDLKNDINLDEAYAFYCGDGNPKTKKGRHIEELAKDKNVSQLKKLMQSINCEEQAYGVAGFGMLTKAGVKISENNEKLLKYLRNRKTTLVECDGCFTTVSKPDKVD